MRRKFIGIVIVIAMAIGGTTMLYAETRDLLPDLNFWNQYTQSSPTLDSENRAINVNRDDPQLIEVIYQDHDDNNWWVDEEKIVFDYDAQDRAIESIISYWDEDEQDWIDETRMTFQWEGENLIDIMVEMNMDRQWQDFIHIEQEFNDQNQVLQAEAWINVMGTWTDFAFYDYDYDANDRLETMTQTFYMEAPETNRQPDFERTNFYYDATDRIDEMIHQISVDGETWTNFERSVIDYHANDNSDYQLFQDWINNNIMHMLTYQLLADEPMTDTETYYEWAAEDWYPFEKDEFDYFENNEYEYMTKYEYFNDEWHILFRDTFLYNEDWVLTQVIYEMYDNGQWNEFGRSLFYYDTVFAQEMTIPTAKLSTRNYPNPFNPETTISFNLPESGNVRVEIYNMRGQKVKTLMNKDLEAGEHQVQWNGKDRQGNVVPSGIYFYRVDAEGGRYTSTRKMLLLK